MRAALVALLIVVCGACAAGQPIQNDLRGVPIVGATFPAKTPISDIESKIADLQGQIAKLKIQAAKIEDVARALQALMPELMAALSQDPHAPSFAKGPTWLAFLSDAIAICQPGHCDKATLTDLETLCRSAGCTPAKQTAFPK